PTTLALVRALTLRSAGFRYCVDEKQVEVTGRARAADVVRGGDGAEFLNRPGGALPLVRLRALLGQPPAEEAHEEFDFVVAATQVAVAVDELGRRGEVLVRGLGRHAARWYGVSGAAELRDGTVALLLDLPRLLETHARS
ncbi:MAG TPA: chemotaxis protein CheW, partial [Pyrinomonadaceae bacterium]|nr:chemotaxis protein CheW [Pyrinomonadaceae bacterium]